MKATRKNTGQFKKGQIPWNKGISHNAGGKSPNHRFRPGSIPANHRPVGSMRATIDGYVEIKISEGRKNWVLLHREIWKHHYGSYPPRNTPIIFVDGNRLNCAINNLELITRRKLMQKNTVHNLPYYIKETVFAKQSLTRFINKNGQKAE